MGGFSGRITLGIKELILKLRPEELLEIYYLGAGEILWTMGRIHEKAMKQKTGWQGKKTSGKH